MLFDRLQIHSQIHERRKAGLLRPPPAKNPAERTAWQSCRSQRHRAAIIIAAEPTCDAQKFSLGSQFTLILTNLRRDRDG